MQSNITLYTDKVLTTDPVKTELVKKLLMEGHITFEQAISLLEKEVKIEYIYVPQVIQPQPVYPYSPTLPYPGPIWVTCDSDNITGISNPSAWTLTAHNTCN